MIAHLARRMRQMVTRGQVALAALNPKRTLVQINGLNGEVKTKVELMHPYGMSALPDAGDVIFLEVGASRAHIVALCADNPALRISDLAKGEFGFRDLDGQQVVFRSDRLEVTTPKKLAITVTGDADIQVGGDADLTVSGTLVVDCDDINLGGTGGHLVKLSDGSNATKVRAI